MGSKNAITTEPRFTFRGNVFRAGDRRICTLARVLYGMMRAQAAGGEVLMTIKHVSVVAAAAICFAIAMPWARADDYPSRPITMVVPLAPGGSTDTLGRIIAQGMRPTLGQPV